MLHPRQWCDDHSTEQCTSCAVAFSLIRCRRHHCRHCGGVFCNACTTSRLWLRPRPSKFRSCGAYRRSQRGSPPVSSPPPSVETPTNAANVSSLLNCGLSLRGAVLSTSEPSENDAQCSTINNSITTATSAVSHARRTSGERLAASFVEVEVPAPLWTATAPKVRREGTERIIHKICPQTSAKSTSTGSKEQQVPLTPSHDSCSIQETRSGHHHRQMSGSPFSTSLHVISHATVTTTGAMSPQTFDAPETHANLEKSSSSQQLRNSSGLLGGVPSRCASFASDSLPQRHRLPEYHLNDKRDQRGIETRDGSVLNDPSDTHNVGGITSMGTAPYATGGGDGGSAYSTTEISINEDDAYRRRSYKVNVDKRRNITWYLCRVCRNCYDLLLDSILDANEAPTAAAATAVFSPPACQSSWELPLWYYVRLSSPREPREIEGWSESPRHKDTPEAPHPGPPTPATAAVRQTAAESNEPQSFGTAAWARFRAWFSEPSSRELSLTTLPGMTASTTSPLSSSSISKPRSTLKELCIGSKQVTHRSTPTTVAPRSSSTLARGRYTPSVHFETPQMGNSTLSLPPPSLSPATHRIISPPRRRLISIDSSSDSVRQAVALARRRRRIAVILVDERDVSSADDDNNEVPLLNQREGSCATPSARPPTNSQAETALQLSAVGKQSPVTRHASDKLHITSAAPQSATGEKDDVHQPSRAREDKTAPHAAAHTAATKPHLSVFVDNVIHGDDGTSAYCIGGSGSDGWPPRELNPTDWLAPRLPIQAAASVHSASTTRTWSSLSSSSLQGRPSLGTPGAPFSTGADVGSGSVATSKPISCVVKCSQPAVAFSTHGTLSAATTTREDGSLPALPVSLDSHACVLRTLFWQIGAAASPTTTTTTPAATTPTATVCPTSTPTLAPHVAGDWRGSNGSLRVSTPTAGGSFVDPTLYGNLQATSTPLRGIDPKVCAAQRQALVLDMIGQFKNTAGVHLSGVVSSFFPGASQGSAYIGAVEHHEAQHFSGTTGQRGRALGRIGGGNYVNSTSINPSGYSTTTACERVIAPVTTHFQLRPPAAANSLLPAATSLTLLPVSTQVELVGIPIDTTAAVSATGPSAPAAAAPNTVSMLTSRLMPTGVRSGTLGSGTTITSRLMGGDIAGMNSRPFTMTEFLSQLAKRSTNLDGYVVVIFRRQSSKSTARAHKDLLGGGATVARPDSNDGSSVRAPVVPTGNSSRNLGKNSMQAHGNPRRKTSAPWLASSTCVSSTQREDDKCAAPLSPHPQSPTRKHRRRHRVTELFKGHHLRSLYQQLENCGVASPVISVAEVSDAAEVCMPNLLPSSLVGAKNSPKEASLCHSELDTPVLSYLRAHPAARGKSGATEGGLGPMKLCLQSPTSSDSATSTASSAVSTHVGWLSSVLTSPAASPPHDTADVRTAPPKNDLEEKRQMSASVGVVPGKKLQLASEAPATALDHAMRSLRFTARQLGVTTCSLTYATATTSPTMGSPSSPDPRDNHPTAAVQTTLRTSLPVAQTPSEVEVGHVGGGSDAVLARALESLVATLVYRDISATLTQ